MERTTNKMLIIPDVHGRKFWRVAERRIDEYEHVVFLGDYLDPYFQELITIDEAFCEFLDILNLKIKYPDKITLLYGNHDLHYYWPVDYGCRRCEEYLTLLNAVFRKSRDKFTLIYERDIAGKKFIFSHAGITKDWLDDNRIEYNADYLNSLLDKPNYGILGQVSFFRGGDDDFGSPVWADLTEHFPPETIPNTNQIFGKPQWIPSMLMPDTYQIFGHTQQSRGPYITEYWACLDCRQAFELSLDTGKISEIAQEIS